MTSNPDTLALRPHHATGFMPQASLEATTDHRRGRHTIRIHDDDGPQAGVRYVDARDLDTATVAFDDLFGDDGMDVAATLAYSRRLRQGSGLTLADVSIVRRDLDGSVTARAAMKTLADLRSVLAEAREAEAYDDSHWPG